MELFFILCSRFRCLACQLLDPFIAIGFDSSRCALEDLVAVQTKQHNRGIPLEHKRAKEGDGQHDSPNADQVIDKYEFGVTAATHDADVDRHLIGGAHACDAKHQQKILGCGVGFGG